MPHNGGTLRIHETTTGGWVAKPPPPQPMSKVLYTLKHVWQLSHSQIFLVGWGEVVMGNPIYK